MISRGRILEIAVLISAVAVIVTLGLKLKDDFKSRQNDVRLSDIWDVMYKPDGVVSYVYSGGHISHIPERLQTIATKAHNKWPKAAIVITDGPISVRVLARRTVVTEGGNWEDTTFFDKTFPKKGGSMINKGLFSP